MLLFLFARGSNLENFLCGELFEVLGFGEIRIGRGKRREGKMGKKRWLVGVGRGEWLGGEWQEVQVVCFCSIDLFLDFRGVGAERGRIMIMENGTRRWGRGEVGGEVWC